MRQIDPGNTKLIYVTYHVDVGETPFLIGVDYTMRSIVVSIRGTLSLKVSWKNRLMIMNYVRDILWKNLIEFIVSLLK